MTRREHVLLRLEHWQREDVGQLCADAASLIKQLHTYGENMRLTCHSLTKRIAELDPLAPVAEVENESRR